jgi:hypothetical protein
MPVVTFFLTLAAISGTRTGTKAELSSSNLLISITASASMFFGKSRTGFT